MATKSYVRYCVGAAGLRAGVLAAALTMVVAGASYAKDPAARIEAHFDGLKEQFKELSMRSQLAKGGVKTGDRVLAREMRETPSFHSLMRVNSKGKVINEVVREGNPGEKFRDVSNQKWFMSAGPRMKSYYTYVRRSDEPHRLFWARPLALKTRSGEFRSAGALVAIVDVDAALSQVDSKLGTPFRLVYEDKVLHSHKWDKGLSAQTRTVELPGMSEVKLRYVSAGGAAQKKAKKTAAAAESAAAAKNGNQKRAAAADTAGGLGMRRSARGLSVIVAPTLVLVALVALILVVFFIQRAARLRNERLMQEIEGKSSASSTRGEASTKPAATPTAEVAQSTRPPRAQEQTVQEPVFAPPRESSPPQGRTDMQQHQPAPQPPPGRSPTPTPGSGQAPAGVSPEMYQRLKQEIYREIVPQLKAQMQQQYEAQRRAMISKVKEFVQEIQIQIDGVADGLNEMQQRASQINASLHDRAAQLRKSLERFEEHGF